MENLINRLMKLLKEHVRQNNEEIRLNQQEIGRILSDAAGQDSRGELDFKHHLNKELGIENEDFIKLQLHLTDFFERYGHLFTAEEGLDDFEEDVKIERWYTDQFTETIQGNIPFNESHPRYNDRQFLNDLIQYYEENENYEYCANLVDLRRKLHGA